MFQFYQVNPSATKDAVFRDYLLGFEREPQLLPTLCEFDQSTDWLVKRIFRSIKTNMFLVVVFKVHGNFDL